MRKPTGALAALGIAAACSSGSGVEPTKTIPQLTDMEWVKLCNFYNDKLKALINQKCVKSAQVIVEVRPLPCGMTNPSAGATCTTRVSDVEACVTKITACQALRVDPAPPECSNGSCFAGN